MSLLMIFLGGVAVMAAVGSCAIAVISIQRASERLDRILSEELDGRQWAETWEPQDSGCPAVTTGGFVMGMLDDQTSSADSRDA